MLPADATAVRKSLQYCFCAALQPFCAEAGYCAKPPPGEGEENKSRSRGAVFRARVLPTSSLRALVKQSSLQLIIRIASSLPLLAMTTSHQGRSKSERAAEAVLSTKRLFSTRFRQKVKGSGTPEDALSYARTQAACGTRHGKGGLRRPPLAGALACRRSTAVLASGTFVPKAQRRARLPENGAQAAACRTHRLGYSEAPRAPVVMPAGMMPEPPGCGVYPSARGRRTRSAFRKYPP